MLILKATLAGKRRPLHPYPPEVKAVLIVPNLAVYDIDGEICMSTRHYSAAGW